MEGRAFLNKYIADRLAAARGRPAAIGGLSVDRSEIRGAAIGLVAAGALAQEQMDRILVDLDQELERLGLLTRIEGRMSGDGHVSPAPWMPLSVEARQQLVLQHGRDRVRWPEATVDTAQLREVISLAGRSLILDAMTAMLISLERWSTMFVLRLARPDADADDLRSLDRTQTRLTRWRGWDDAGTQYHCRTGSTERRGGLSMETLVLFPGAPDQAHTLTLAFDHGHGTEQLTVAIAAATTQA